MKIFAYYQTFEYLYCYLHRDIVHSFKKPKKQKN